MVSSGLEDRDSLRKGKWIQEEETFATRLIQLFNQGLLVLPEGMTLRSYLAEKLNCDPMRITKKFTGASCLGKRVFHSRKHTDATLADMQTAQHELNCLEARFHSRLEHDRERSKEACMIDLEVRTARVPRASRRSRALPPPVCCGRGRKGAGASPSSSSSSPYSVRSVLRRRMPVRAQARFLNASNVVSSPAIDAFIMQSCATQQWTSKPEPDDDSASAQVPTDAGPQPAVAHEPVEAASDLPDPLGSQPYWAQPSQATCVDASTTSAAHSAAVSAAAARVPAASAQEPQDEPAANSAAALLHGVPISAATASER